MTKQNCLPEYLMVGHSQIDTQHGVLFSLFDDIEHVTFDSAVLPDLDGIIIDLIKYIDTHFKFEEELMRSSDYPHCKRHRYEHKTMMAHVQGYLIRYKSDKESSREISIDIHDFIKSWITNHIAAEDKGLSHYLNNKS
jgi:hemerythrin-like metal-binding protein